MIGAYLQNTGNHYRHLALEECVSTNTSCLQLAGDGDPGNLWVTANRQTGGRGTRGRRWDGGTGNLLVSLLLRNPSPRKNMAELAFVSALAARKAISELSNDECQVALKWPNDVLVNGRKCGGILLESRLIGSDLVVVIGFGINCESFPPQTAYPATSLKQEGLEISAHQLFLMLTNSMVEMLEIWNRGGNFKKIRKLWIQHAHGLGGNVKISVPGRDMVEGRFSGISSSGHLCVETEDGLVQEIPAADVFFGNTPDK